MSTPLVSFLIPMYNAGEGIRYTLRSILLQTIKDFEIVIVDDGSTDNSTKIALATYPQAIIVWQKNLGITEALNHGIAHCQGKYIARIDCFDIAYPERIELQLKKLESEPEIGAIGGHIILYEDNSDIGLCKYPLPESEIELDLLSGNCPLPHSGATLRKSVLLEIGGYDPFFNGREDFELWTRLSLVAQIANVDAPIMRILSTRSGISFDGGKLSPLVALALLERQGKKLNGMQWKNEQIRSTLEKRISNLRNRRASESEKKQLSAIFYSKRAGFILKSGNKLAALREYLKSISSDPTYIKAWFGILRTIIIPKPIDGWVIKQYKKLKIYQLAKQN